MSYRGFQCFLISFLYCKGAFACLYVWAPGVQCLAGQERALDPLDLELQTVVSIHVGAGN